MAGLSSVSRRFRAVPWLLVYAALRVLYEHWSRIPADDRQEAIAIVRSARGNLLSLSDRDRRRLVEIARNVDPVGLARDVADAATPFPTPGLKQRKPKA